MLTQMVASWRPTILGALIVGTSCLSSTAASAATGESVWRARAVQARQAADTPFSTSKPTRRTEAARSLWIGPASIGSTSRQSAKREEVHAEDSRQVVRHELGRVTRLGFNVPVDADWPGAAASKTISRIGSLPREEERSPQIETIAWLDAEVETHRGNARAVAIHEIGSDDGATSPDAEYGVGIDLAQATIPTEEADADSWLEPFGGDDSRAPEENLFDTLNDAPQGTEELPTQDRRFSDEPRSLPFQEEPSEGEPLSDDFSNVDDLMTDEEAAVGLPDVEFGSPGDRSRNEFGEEFSDEAEEDEDLSDLSKLLGGEEDNQDGDDDADLSDEEEAVEDEMEKSLRAEEKRNSDLCREEMEGLREYTLDRVSLDISIQGREGEDFPFECTIDQGQPYPYRSWESITYTWKASALCHKPLYFEEVELERYGHSWGRCLQPIVSGAHFFSKLPVLPYCMGYTPPCECMYALGYYRPGSCAPFMIPAIPISGRGALIQAGSVVGAAALLP